MMLEYAIYWETAKDWISSSLGVSHAVLHIHIGLAAFLLLSRFSPRGIGSAGALLLVLALELANEGVDFMRYQLSGWPWTPEGTIADIFNTMFWPVCLFLGRRFSRPRATDPATPDADKPTP